MPSTLVGRRTRRSGALAECYSNLAKALGPSDREDALKQYKETVELVEHLTLADSNNAQYRIALADALTNEARLNVRMAGWMHAGWMKN